MGADFFIDALYTQQSPTLTYALDVANRIASVGANGRRLFLMS